MRISNPVRGRSRRALMLPVAAGALWAAGCADLNTPDYNRPAIDDLRNNPNATLINAASVGLVGSSRQDAANYVRYLGILGREAYYLDSNENRYVTQLVDGDLDPSSFAGGGLWTNRYGSIRLGNTILRALDNLPANQLTAAQQEGVRGWTQTFKAIDFLAIANERLLAPINVDIEPTADPAPLATRAEIYQHVKVLLDSGLVHLNAAGSSFSFNPTVGFTQYGFGNPAGMRQVNRALRARVDVLTGDYAAAITHLAESFITTPTSGNLETMHRGVYYPFGTGSGDLVNALTSAAPQAADTLLRTQAERQVTGDTLDARYVRKVRYRTSGGNIVTRSQLGISTNLIFSHYNQTPFFGSGGQGSPIPIIRNEELILLRAEARWMTGDLPGAIADLNYVRTISGNLAPRLDLTAANFREALLHERRYSLLYEGGWRWLDLRRFGLLDRLDNYPRAGDYSPEAMPIPFAECLARGEGSPGC
jgi:starch-binding outer membrane protein, SusD/RagB family